MTNGEGSGEGSSGTASIRSPRAFTVLVVFTSLVLLVSLIVLAAAFFLPFFIPRPLEEYQENLLNTFEDGFKMSLSALIGLVAGKVTTS